MNKTHDLIWNNQKVGTVTDLVMDMWYCQATLCPTNSDVFLQFKELVSTVAAEDVIRNPSKGEVISLAHNEEPSARDYYLALSVSDSEIFMRLISDEVANSILSDKVKKSADSKSHKPWWKFW